MGDKENGTEIFISLLNYTLSELHVRYVIIYVAGLLYGEKQHFFLNGISSWHLGATTVPSLSTGTPWTLTRTIHLCLSNAKKERIIFHWVLPEAMTTPLSSHSENIFFCYIVEWVEVIESIGLSLTSSPSLTSPLPWLLKPWSIKAENRTCLNFSKISDSFVLDFWSFLSLSNWTDCLFDSNISLSPCVFCFTIR